MGIWAQGRYPCAFWIEGGNMSGKLSVTVELVETHLNEETFEIDALPHDWDEMDEMQQWHYLQAFGHFVGAECEFYEVDHIKDIVV
jgi:hypothetical protein